MAKSFAVLLGAGVLAALACLHCGGDDSEGTPSSGAGGTAAGVGGGGNGLAANCQTRCEAVANKCQYPTAICTQACATLTEAQAECLEAAPCDMGAMQNCLTSSGAGGSSGGQGGSSNQGGSSSQGGSANQGGASNQGGAGGADQCMGQSGKCIYDEFFSEGCKQDDPDRPYWITCCEAEPSSSQDCVIDKDEGFVKSYCCAQK
ncbi:MAG TPA: hypothetical protein PLI95_30010 [Polyangiaceae bacterium]|nr:hypothetical protein [Polyangiaceae bacterium]